ncbi:DUF4136 domain-containing protein [Maribacter polysaccharolyticus]|uniref:DUF4136 domain-containing protein n=1 Tax=Maribacter polysaccharolyticus TaxID=3020831 RepID=UPI00237FA4A1|nr:DUF4136 domain-containing protein [Maribacter polysaccharolyticus]MDE3741538.1 DUF4136 domain-containing protein [Maribacter polysaccharolyticus]
MKIIPYLLLVLLFTSCQAVRVQTDYQKGTDFSNYATYNYYSDMETGLGDLEERRFLKVLDAALRGKGLLLSEEPDFFINIQSEIYQTPNDNTVGLGVGGGGRNVAGGLSVGIPIASSKVQREIILDFIDSQKEQLFWQAVSSSSFHENTSPTEREAKLQEIVEKVLSKYPPKTK